MKIAISTDGDEVCAHFGRAPQFSFITLEGNKVLEKEVLPNPGHSVGSIPQFLNEQGTNTIITGGMGHRAIQFFADYGIDVIMGVSGKVNVVIDKILDGTLEGGESLCNPGAGKGFGVEKIHTEADDNPENHQQHH